MSDEQIINPGCITSFGDRVRELREQAGLSQDEMAKQMGFSQAYISSMERKQHAPAEKTLEKLAEFFDVDVGYFLGTSQSIIINRDLADEIYVLREVLKQVVTAPYLRDATELAERALAGKIIGVRHEGKIIIIDMNGSGWYSATGHQED